MDHVKVAGVYMASILDYINYDQLKRLRIVLQVEVNTIESCFSEVAKKD